MQNISLIDTHCHIHELERRITPTFDKWKSDGVERTAESVLSMAQAAGVDTVIVIGTTLEDSQLAVEVAQKYPHVYASIGIHPHETQSHTSGKIIDDFASLSHAEKVVAIGECGLDYYYNHANPRVQQQVLRHQLRIAQERNLPVSFHVRDAFDDFWPIFDEYQGLRGVLHSFTDSPHNMESAVERGLYIGVNGIATFAKTEDKSILYQSIPLENLVLETDAPFLTPIPFRGKMCEPKHVRVTAEFLANIRGVELADLARITTANARKLFTL